MTDTQLIYFSKVVELGSFSEAALALNISQSSVSKQIIQLEDELGVKLFDRSGRKPVLSHAGEHLYQDALLALSQIQHMKAVAKQLAASGKRTISILTLPVIGHYNFYIPIQLFENAHTDYDIELEELEEPEMYRRIQAGQYDAAITYFRNTQLTTQARFYPIIEDEMVLVCHSDHPLYGNASVTPHMLDDMPVLAMQKYTIIDELYRLYFQKHNSNPHIIFRGRPESILVGAESGRGPALLTRIHTKTMRMTNVSLIPMQPPLKCFLGLIINENSPNAELVKELIEPFTKAGNND